MNILRLDSVLLFALAIPFVMGYRLSPGDTPFWFFGLIFLGLLLYLVLDLLKLKEKTFFKLKNTILWVVIVGIIGSAFYSAIVVRHRTHPVYMVHDIILQQESAIRFLLHGTNPYSTTYFGTPLEQWHYSDKETNPALYHFVMEPFYLLFSVPFYLISTRTFGFFDGRIPLVFLFFGLLFLVGRIVNNPSQKFLALVLFAFNPAMLSYTLEGRSDVFMFAFLFLGFFLLEKQKFLLAGIPIALSFAVKQSAWPLLPFYFAFVYFKNKSISKTLKDLSIFAITFVGITLPFFLWDQKAFLDSTVLYLSGNIEHGYPISGYGWGMVLTQLGVIKDANQYYPFQIWQIVIGIPLAVFLIKNLKNNLTVGRLIIAYGIFLFVFWYFSRYLNNSHLGYLSFVFMAAYFWPKRSK